MKNVVLSQCALGLAFALTSSVAFAGDQPSMTCALTDTAYSGTTVKPISEFKTDVEKIYIYCDTTDLDAGQVVSAKWIAVDTKKAAPDNYVIATSQVSTPKKEPGKEVLTFDFSLSKPTKGWPAGNYRVDIYIDDQKKANTSKTFEVVQ